MKNVTKYLAAIAAVVSAATASAVPTLYISDGVNSITLVDGGAAVVVGAATAWADPTGPGATTYIGTIGSWTLNVSTGTTDPVTTAPYPHLDLNSVNASTTPSTLTIRWSDTDFGPSSGQHMSMLIGGTVAAGAGNSLLFNLYGDASNTALGTATPLGTLGAFGPGAFSGSGVSAVNLGVLGASYSITEEIILTHRVAGSSSFNAEAQITPDGGATLILLGSGLAGLAFLRRKLIK